MASASASVVVIIAEEMQKSVHDEMLHMMLERDALSRASRCDGLQRQHDIAEKARIVVVDRNGGPGGKRQHVGRRHPCRDSCR